MASYIIEKSICIQGNLKNQPIKYKLCPSDEFSRGRWAVAIASVAFTSKQNVNLCCQITSNFTVKQRYSKEDLVESFEEPLAVCTVNFIAEQHKLCYSKI